MRQFNSGATRDDNNNKPDFEGFLSPLVIRRFGEYMLLHQIQADGAVRDSDNWQKGIPKNEYIKSGFRHFMDWWLEHRGHESRDGLQDALCALMFNCMGYLHELLKEKTSQVNMEEEYGVCRICGYPTFVVEGDLEIAGCHKDCYINAEHMFSSKHEP